MFSNVGEMKNRWYENFTQKGDVKHNSNFQNIFENQGILFSKMDKKGIAKKCETFQNEGFFGQKKLKRQKKTGDAKVYRKSSKNHRNQKEGKTEQETCALPPKKEKKQNKENRGKNGEKMKIEKNEEEHTNQERETRREREKEIHKRGVKKEARELCKKCKKKE